MIGPRSRPPAPRASLGLLSLAGLAAAGCSAGPIDVATLAPTSLSTGLMAHWTFDETLGITAHDTSGNGRDGTISGFGYSWDPGKFGNALRFGGPFMGNGDYVTVGAFPPAPASFTVSAWLYFASADLGPNVSSIGALMSNEALGGGGWSMNVAMSAPSSLMPANYDFVYYLGPPMDYAFTSCDCFTTDTWIHLAGVVDAGTTMTFYVNGQIKAQLPVAHGITAGIPTLYLGRWPGLGRFLTGTMDDVAIWNRALVPEEILQLEAAPVKDPI
jgi:hypothetical protein